MKFSIDQTVFYPALQAVARSCGVRSQLPVLLNVLISASSGKVRLLATNLEVGAVKSLSAKVEEDGEVTIPARTLAEIVANLGGQKLTLVADSANLTISTPSFNSEVNGMNASEFPSIPLQGKEAINFTPQTLVESVPQISFAAAVDEARPILTGILTEVKGGSFQLVATDGFRLAHKQVALEQKGDFRALIPKTSLEEVVRLLGEEEADQVGVSISEDGNQMIFSFGDTQLSTRLIEGQFPAWEKIVPEEFKSRVVLDRLNFLKAVKLASVFAKSEANVVTLLTQKDKVELISEAKELGNQKNELEAQVEGEAMQIALNARYLNEALGAIAAHQVVLELSGALSAVLLKPLGDDSLEYVIMPVNLG